MHGMSLGFEMVGPCCFWEVMGACSHKILLKVSKFIVPSMSSYDLENLFQTLLGSVLSYFARSYFAQTSMQRICPRLTTDIGRNDMLNEDHDVQDLERISPPP